MTLPDTLAIASKNEHKVREILEICSDWPVSWVTARDRSWPDVDETGDTYLANARLKAEAVARAIGVPAIADDSGIEVDALGGEPGLRSARFAGETATDEENLRLLIERIELVPPPARTARYRCVAVCTWPDGRTLGAEGVCEGTLVVTPRGSGGFGYDPVFVPTSAPARTMAELSAREKHEISHRGLAFGRLGDLLRAHAPGGA